jgi:peptidoglycan/LPS O-acetylase OafA/YrhL
MRVPALDGVRGLAIALVLLGHLTKKFTFAGGTGVTLFFVLSGYLITTLLLKESDRTGEIKLPAFYVRRACRLLPALVVVIALTPLLLWAFNDPRLGGYAGDIPSALFYYEDILAAIHGASSILGHTWSLSVEEQFYFVGPICLILALRFVSEPRRLFRLIVALTGIAVAWHLASTFLFDGYRTYFAPDTNAYALLLGCSLAAFHRRGGHLRAAGLPIGLAALAVIVAAPFVIGFAHWSSWHVTNVATVMVAGAGLILIADSSRIPLLAHPVLRYLGRISYGLYLWHVIFLDLSPNGRIIHGPERPVAVVLAIVVAGLSFRYVETPFLRLKERWDTHGSARPELTTA